MRENSVKETEDFDLHFYNTKREGKSGAKIYQTVVW